ncbi:NTP transferase domain-containing protein [Flexivirga sp. ID2601S]|uniref:NTP transferase domain-containing protein n=1 Tax=Flexivirga aerilata TaxID=1656889 RepID=A0A849AJD2_9MICO|nr:mannose-1-phosphate guanylyltransferase [Flexivirga aerilata]NNG40103.1 NTP transferase domain-containing protein [Flexivirga aerilata]
MSEISEGPIDGFWAVIPAGGSGTRLWPLSRSGSPKFLHDLTGSGWSLLQGTVDRLAPLSEQRLLIVTGLRHAEEVREQLPDLGIDSLLVEPSPRESMPAIGLAAAILAQRDPDAIIGSFAADHVIRDDESFRRSVREAVAVAQTGMLVTIGIEPTSPATGFGYIKLGSELDVQGAPRAHGVESFVEKPDATTAQSYLDSGDYRWNAGMFVFKATALLEMLDQYQPGLAADLRAIAGNPLRLTELWPRLTEIAIDKAIAEPAAADGRVAVIPGEFDWDDVGDFDSLASLLSESADGVKVLGKPEYVVAQETTGVIAPRSGRVVVTLGVEDIIVVDTSDAVLVTTRARAQDVKRVVQRLKADGRADLT